MVKIVLIVQLTDYIDEVPPIFFELNLSVLSVSICQRTTCDISGSIYRRSFWLHLPAIIIIASFDRSISDKVKHKMCYFISLTYM